MPDEPPAEPPYAAHYDDPDFDPDLAPMKHALDQLTVGLMIRTGSIDALYGIVKLLAARAGLATLDGLPVKEWYRKTKTDRVERFLLEVEEISPGYAARLQVIWDETCKRDEEKDQL